MRGGKTQGKIMNWEKETDRIANLAVSLVLNKKHTPKHLLNPRFVKRHDIRGKLKMTVFEIYENKCEICSISKNLIIHHDIPLYRGGSNNISNLRLLCKDCHDKLHKEDMIIFRQMAQERKRGLKNPHKMPL